MNVREDHLKINDRLMICLPDPPTFAARMNNNGQSMGSRMKNWLKFAGTFLVLLIPFAASAQGNENFTNLPTANTGTYLARTWVGTDGVTWTAEGARTDQVINGKAICFGTGGNRWVTSPSYAGGMGTLTFNYVRAFTNTTARSFQIWVNGAQVGPTVVVSPTSDVITLHSQAINIGGNVVLEIRSTGASQIKIDDISWTPFTAGPTAEFSANGQSVPEDAGAVPVTLTIDPATSAAGTITLSVLNGAGVTYGAGGDYTTVPAVVAGNITLNVPAGATTASFQVNVVDDIITEPNETITFTLTGATGGTFIGGADTHTLTILDNDVTPTVDFSTLSISVLENSFGPHAFQLSINPPAPAAGSITIQVINGPGAAYGMGNDYLTNPAIIGGNITVNFPAGATAASFTVSVLDDTEIEDTETITFTVIGVPAGFAIGGNMSADITIGDNDTPPTELSPGDLVIVGVNANTNGCGGASGHDEISFFCFKPIVPGTTIIITDNGYQRCNPGLWGNSEGTVRMTRLGMAIPAGQVITFRVSNFFGANNITSMAPDNAWSCTSLNGNTTVNLNQGGDQIFFMQGGMWTTGTAGAHNATYDGTILFGFTTNATFPWTASCASSPNQRSDLPPGIECFSMAPTLATDFNKYEGPITAASQRNWIIRVDDVTNWTTYANCADYSASGYDWLSAPILPITAASFQPGKWTGAKDTDWFECKNWDDARVPTIATDVLINEEAIRHCVVGLPTGLSPGGTGVCATLNMSNAGASRNLTIDANSTLLVNGGIEVERTAGTGVLNLNLQGGATLSGTDLFLSSVNPGEARLNVNTGTSLASLEGNLTIGAGGRVALTTGTIQLGGNWSNLESEAMFVENIGNVIFNGPGDQFVASTGFEDVFYNLQINKPSGIVQLAAPTAIRGTLDLLSGLVHTTATDLLTMRAGSASINFSDASFVHGPMQKIGLTPFTFPVGKGTNLRPCGLRNIAGTATDAFTAEYFPISPIATFNNILEPTLHHISDCEYWMIDRSSGSANARVELSWDTPESCGVTEITELRVARFNGAMWLDRGNGGAIGDNITGVIPTAAVETLFSPWTLASVFASNPLPITLISFDAKKDGHQVRLDWQTATEVNNELFTVERSADGYDFEDILSIPGAGTSYSLLQYTEFDRSPMSGINYYRLRQTDHDGTESRSAIASVVFADTDRPMIVFGTADVINAVHTFVPGSRYEILDMTGRMIHQGLSDQDGRTEVAAGRMTRGAYIFRMSDGDRVESIRFVY